jgi:tRNA U34 5-carboxymethylaminomethyl modifying GTPase MnmE/TrmE
MSNEKKTEKKMSELDKRIEERLGKKEEMKQFVCLVDGEKFERVSDMLKWLHRVHRMSSTRYIELLIHELDRAEKKITELEVKQ